MNVTVYHNPNCGTSRKVLDILREKKMVPEIIEYLVTPPKRDELVSLIKRMGTGVRSLIREKDKHYDELGLADPKWTDEQLIDFIVTHPILMNRPLVVTSKGVKLCRPAETVLELL